MSSALRQSSMWLLLSGIALRRFVAGLRAPGGSPPRGGPKISRSRPARRSTVSPVLLSGIALLMLSQRAPAQEPPSLNPFGSSADQKPRDDSMPGYLETSDGRVHAGQLFLTRDARFKIYDEERKRQREIPLKAIKRIDCVILKEWNEKEWRFKENASDEKFYTGRSYPARIHPQDHAPERPGNRRRALGHRLRPGRVQQGPGAISAPQARQGKPRDGSQIARVCPLDPPRREGAGRRQAEGRKCQVAVGRLLDPAGAGPRLARPLPATYAERQHFRRSARPDRQNSWEI